jgi:hypothetical protein
MVTECDDESGEGDKEELDSVRGDEDPAAAGPQEAVEAAEEEGSYAERCYRDEGLDPSITRVRERLCDSETHVDGVA